MLRGKDGYGRKEVHVLLENPAIQEGDDNLNIPSAILGDVFELRSLKNLLVTLKSLKREVERCLERLKVGQLSSGLGHVEGPAKGGSYEFKLNSLEKASAESPNGVGPLVFGTNESDIVRTRSIGRRGGLVFLSTWMVYGDEAQC